jgi:ABC-type glycerol-3-phosphate transport system substrate-binding protein
MSGSTRRAFLARSLAWGVGASSLASLVASCTGDDRQADDDKPVVPRPAGSAKRYRGEVVIATRYTPSASARRALAAAYRQQQPKVRVVWETRDFADSAAYSRWLDDQLVGSRIRPDIVSGDLAPNFGGFVDFEQYRAQVNPYTGRPWQDDYHFGLYRTLDARGERPTLATEGAQAFWYYNRDVFADVGVEPPTTWSELVEVCRKLRAARHVPVATRFDTLAPGWLATAYFDQFHDSWVDVVRAKPGDWNWNPELDDAFEYRPDNPLLHSTYTYSPQRFYRALHDRTLRFDTPAMVELFAQLARVFPRYTLEDFTVRTDAYAPFLTGATAMMVEGSWCIPQLQADLAELTPERLAELRVEASSVRPFEWDVFTFPTMEGPLVQSAVRNPEGTTGTTIAVVDKNPVQTELVMDFVMFWLSRPGFSAYMQGEIDAEEATPKGPPMVKGVEYPEELKSTFGRVRQRGVVAPAYGSFWVSGAGGSTGEAMKSLFVSALQRELNAQEYVTRLQRYVQTNFAAILNAAHLTSDDIANPARRPARV